MSDVFFDECRTFGHAWYRIKPTAKPQFGYYLWLQCDRCGTVRKDTIDLRGSVGIRSYDYTEGYQQKGKTPREDYRLRVVKRRKSSRAGTNLVDSVNPA